MRNFHVSCKCKLWFITTTKPDISFILWSARLHLRVHLPLFLCTAVDVGISHTWINVLSSFSCLYSHLHPFQFVFTCKISREKVQISSTCTFYQQNLKLLAKSLLQMSLKIILHVFLYSEGKECGNSFIFPIEFNLVKTYYRAQYKETKVCSRRSRCEKHVQTPANQYSPTPLPFSSNFTLLIWFTAMATYSHRLIDDVWCFLSSIFGNPSPFTIPKWKSYIYLLNTWEISVVYPGFPRGGATQEFEA